jgi:hypothetical protein
MVDQTISAFFFAEISPVGMNAKILANFFRKEALDLFTFL